ncbi:MAG: hypothetical protein KatS3mg129_2176 [Leptospiraceae bacterium]|nr:MAG: hypothetical protein KatS3mg129_2176 [Leptospiraceae bacterium]
MSSPYKKIFILTLFLIIITLNFNFRAFANNIKTLSTDYEKTTIKPISYKKENIKIIEPIDSFYKDLKNFINHNYGNSINPGASLLAFQNDNPILSINYHFSAISKIPLASVSKTFTAVLVLKLEEKGYLNISDSVSKYFPVYRKYEKHLGPITIKDLLSHTSGIPYNTRYIYDDGYSLPEPIFTKGNYHYSNHNYILLSLLIEKITQKPFKELIQQYIINAIDLKQTELASYLTGSSGIISNAYDLTNFCQYLLNDYQIRKENSYLYRMIYISN